MLRRPRLCDLRRLEDDGRLFEVAAFTQGRAHHLPAYLERVRLLTIAHCLAQTRRIREVVQVLRREAHRRLVELRVRLGVASLAALVLLMDRHVLFVRHWRVIESCLLRRHERRRHLVLEYLGRLLKNLGFTVINTIVYI